MGVHDALKATHCAVQDNMTTGVPVQTIHWHIQVYVVVHFAAAGHTQDTRSLVNERTRPASMLVSVTMHDGASLFISAALCCCSALTPSLE